MLRVEVMVEVLGGFSYNGKIQDVKRFDTFRCFDEDISYTELVERIKRKYVGTPIEFKRVENIYKVDEVKFANMGNI